MKLIWHGHSCFTVETVGGSAVFDPYSDGVIPGLAPLRLTADAVYCSHDHRDHNARGLVTLTGCVPSFTVEPVACHHDTKLGLLRGKNTIHILSAEGMRVAHLGDLGHRLRGEALKKLHGVDALLLPVGGYYTVDAATAKKITEDVEPRVVIPMHYRLGSMGYSELAELSEFTKLVDPVINYDSNVFELTADTAAQTAVLRYANA
ncbi:MAG: MBL fold metallo-hydrolase [Oscillospiraceae bacterium]